MICNFFFTVSFLISHRSCINLYDAIQWCVFGTPNCSAPKTECEPKFIFIYFLEKFMRLELYSTRCHYQPWLAKKDSSPVAAGRAALEVQPHMKQLGFNTLKQRPKGAKTNAAFLYFAHSCISVFAIQHNTTQTRIIQYEKYLSKPGSAFQLI